MAATTAPAPAREGEATESTGEGPAPAPPRAETPPQTSARYETGSSLLAPPSYDNIVGGVPPSPYASLMLLGGLICLLLAAVEAATGPGSLALPQVEIAGALLSQWAVLGGALIVGAVFLAGFVSRS